MNHSQMDLSPISRPRRPRGRGKCIVTGCILAIVLALACCSCSWIDPTLIGDVIGIIEEIEVPAPTPEATPTPAVKNLYHLPIYKFTEYNGPLPPGIVTCTPSYVPGKRDKGYSTSVGAVQFMHSITGEVHHLCAETLPLESPPGEPGGNWFRKEDCRHFYTTAHQTAANPNANGTRRGRVIVEWRKPGPWTFWIKWRATDNRKTAWLAVTLERDDPNSPGGKYRETYWSKWNQRGDGEGDETYVCPVIAEAVEFVAGGE